MEEDLLEIKLSKKELELITDSILYTANTDVCIDNYSEEIQKLNHLAINFRKQYPSIFSSKAFLWTRNSYEFADPYTSEIVNFFPELLENVHKP